MWWCSLSLGACTCCRRAITSNIGIFKGKGQRESLELDRTKGLPETQHFLWQDMAAAKNHYIGCLMFNWIFMINIHFWSNDFGHVQFIAIPSTFLHLTPSIKCARLAAKHCLASLRHGGSWPAQIGNGCWVPSVYNCKPRALMMLWWIGPSCQALGCRGFNLLGYRITKA